MMERKKRVRKAAINDSKIDQIDQIIDRHEGKADLLIQILLEIQSENRWLPKEALEKVSKKLQVPLSRIQHIATFYKAFSLVPKGRHEIHICMGTACHVRGAPRVLDTVQHLTGIKPGETDLDLKFSLETVNCLGCCALGPVMEVDGKAHGKIAPAETADVLKNYEEGKMMARLNSPEELEKVRQEILSRRDPNTPCISICAGAGCIASGAGEVIAAFKAEIEKQGLQADVNTKETGGPGFWERGPGVVIYPEEVCYLQVTPEDVPEIVYQTLKER